MDNRILQLLNDQISKLQQAKRILEGSDGVRETSVSRPRKKMSAAARKKIGDAQRDRWAKLKTKGKYHLGIAMPPGMEAQEKRARRRWAKLGLDKPKNNKKKKAA